MKFKILFQLNKNTQQMDDTGQPILQPTDIVEQNVSSFLLNSIFSKTIHCSNSGFLNYVWKHFQIFITFSQFKII